MINIIMYNMSPYRDWQKHGIVNRNRMVLETMIVNKNDLGIDKIFAVDFLPYTFKRKIREVIRADLFGNQPSMTKKGYMYALRQPQKNFFQYSGLDDADIPSLLHALNFYDNPLVAISYNPFSTNFLKLNDTALTVFETVDNWVHNPVYKNVQSQLHSNYNEIATSTDLIFTVSESLTEMYHDNAHCYHVPNGVDTAFFQSIRSVSPNPLRKALTLPNKQIVGYVGTIQHRFDFELMRYLATHNEDVHFLIGGPVMKTSRAEADSLGKLPNVQMTGRVSYEDLPAFIQLMDVGIVPHIIDEFTRSMNPMKIFDYLAAGKPVVATPSSQLSQFHGVVYTAKDYEDFNAKIKTAFSRDMSEEGPNFVKQHSWEHRVGRMVNLIHQALQNKS